ncbi:MAG: hypothetical protein IPN38_01810 [Flavobacteriales bacterium]|nr:hypothetical protein [Flavobacteriales bacterium]
MHDAYTINNITYTNDVDGMHIIDFNDVSTPVLLGSLRRLPAAGLQSQRLAQRQRLALRHVR